MDIFGLLKTQSIVSYDNGRKFASIVLPSLKEYRSILKIIHGNPHHLQNDGRSKRANQAIEKNVYFDWYWKFTSGERDQVSFNLWITSLSFWDQKNTIWRSSTKAKVGLKTSSLAQVVLYHNFFSSTLIPQFDSRCHYKCFHDLMDNHFNMHRHHIHGYSCRCSQVHRGRQ